MQGSKELRKAHSLLHKIAIFRCCSLARACVRIGSRKWSENEIELRPQINESVKKIDSEMYQIGFAIFSATIAFKVATDAVRTTISLSNSPSRPLYTNRFIWNRCCSSSNSTKIFAHTHNVFIWFDFEISAARTTTAKATSICVGFLVVLKN